MVEKFIDNEGAQFLQKPGKYEFVIDSAELRDTANGDSKMVVFNLKCDEGTIRVYHSLKPQAKWTYNNLIKAALNLTPEQRRTLELDYETFHQQLIGHHVIADVIEDYYTKTVKKPLDDGTFEEAQEETVTLKVDTKSYQPV